MPTRSFAGSRGDPMSNEDKAFIGYFIAGIKNVNGTFAM
jgi:hypothetical protein